MAAVSGLLPELRESALRNKRKVTLKSFSLISLPFSWGTLHCNCQTILWPKTTFQPSQFHEKVALKENV